MPRGQTFTFEMWSSTSAESIDSSDLSNARSKGRNIFKPHARCVDSKFHVSVLVEIGAKSPNALRVLVVHGDSRDPQNISSRWALMAARGWARLILNRRRDFISDCPNCATAAEAPLDGAQGRYHFDNPKAYTHGAYQRSEAA
jgi:hypothetical protein